MHLAPQHLFLTQHSSYLILSHLIFHLTEQKHEHEREHEQKQNLRPPVLAALPSIHLTRKGERVCEWASTQQPLPPHPSPSRPAVHDGDGDHDGTSTVQFNPIPVQQRLTD